MNRTLSLCLVVLCAACSQPSPAPGKMTPKIDGAPADVTAPYLVSHTPDEGARDVSLITMISLELSEGIERSSLELRIDPVVPLDPPQWSADDTSVSVITAQLSPGTTYTVTVTAQDAAGLPLAPNTAFSFTTTVPPVLTTPALLGTTPQAGATRVPVGQAIALRFSEAMDEGSMHVTVDPPVALGQSELAESGSLLRFPAMAPFAAATHYTITVSGKSAQAIALATVTFAFDTDAPTDTVPPTVEGSAPAAASQGVPTTASISVKFSEAMNRASAEAAFSVSPTLPCAFVWDSAGERLFCLPGAPLAPGAHYQVLVGTAATDLAGNALAAAFTLDFDTLAAPDTTPPAFVSSSPAKNAVGVALDAEVTIVFSESMDPASTEAAFSALQVALPVALPLHGTFRWSAGNTTLSFKPSSLGHGALVSWTVGAAATDAAGNALQAAASGSFHTLRLVQQTLYSVASLDGSVTSLGSVSTTNPALGVGDFATGSYQRAFLSFDLGQLAAGTVRVTGAALYAYQTGTVGFAYNLGTLYAYGVVYGGSLEAADFNVAPQANALCRTLPLCSLGPVRYALSTTNLPGYKSVAVDDKVQADFAARAAQGNRSQWRLQFASDDNFNGLQDSASFAAGEAANRPYLVVTIEAP